MREDPCSWVTATGNRNTVRTAPTWPPPAAVVGDV